METDRQAGAFPVAQWDWDGVDANRVTQFRLINSWPRLGGMLHHHPSPVIVQTGSRSRDRHPAPRWHQGYLLFRVGENPSTSTSFISRLLR